MSSGYVILLNVVLFPLPSCFGSAGELWLSGLFLSSPAFQVASLVAQLVKNLPAMWETWIGKIPWRRERLPNSSVLVWRNPWTEDPGRLQSMGLQRVGHDCATFISSLQYTSAVSNV